jgi:hypothetical protein
LQTVLGEQKNENFDTNPALAPGVGRAAGATHVIFIEISPSQYYETPVDLRVVEVDAADKANSGGRVEMGIHFKFKRAELEAWQP